MSLLKSRKIQLSRLISYVIANKSQLSIANSNSLKIILDSLDRNSTYPRKLYLSFGSIFLWEKKFAPIKIIDSKQNVKKVIPTTIYGQTPHAPRKTKSIQDWGIGMKKEPKQWIWFCYRIRQRKKYLQETNMDNFGTN